MQIWTMFNQPLPFVMHLCPQPYALLSGNALPYPPLCLPSFMNDPNDLDSRVLPLLVGIECHALKRLLITQSVSYMYEYMNRIP